MKKYLLIVASLCLVACGGKDKSKYYLLLNDSDKVLQVNDEQVSRDQCFDLRDGEYTSDFPLSLSKISEELVVRNPVEVKEPGHYIWNGSEAVKVADKDVEEHKKICKDKKKEAAADPNIQASTSPTAPIADDKPQYVIFNKSSTDLNFNGKIVAANHCTESGFLSSDFPIKTDEMSLEEPGHYIWNGSVFVKAEEEYIKTACKEISDPTVQQPVSSSKKATPAGETSSGEAVQAEGDSKALEQEADPKLEKISITVENVAVTSVPKTDDQAADPNVQASTDPTSPDEKIEPRYFVYNESNEDLSFNAETVAANHCTESGFLSSDFPLKVDEMSLGEPGHYVWNGSEFVKAEEEYIKAVCKKISDPTVQPASSSEAESSTPTVTSETTEQSTESADTPAAAAPAVTKVAIYSYLQHLSPIMLEKCSQQYSIGSIHTFISSDGNICQVSEHPLDKCEKKRDTWRKKYEDQGFQCESSNETRTPTGDCKSNLMVENLVCAK